MWAHVAVWRLDRTCFEFVVISGEKNENLSEELTQTKTQLGAMQAEVAHIKTFIREAHGKCIWSLMICFFFSNTHECAYYII